MNFRLVKHWTSVTPRGIAPGGKRWVSSRELERREAALGARGVLPRYATRVEAEAALRDAGFPLENYLLTDHEHEITRPDILTLIDAIGV